MQFLVPGEEFRYFSPEYIVHDDAGNGNHQSDRRGFQCKAEPDHNGIDGHGS